ncbi:MAG: siroheme decarboxylase subunit beta [Methanoregula sp.]
MDPIDVQLLQELEWGLPFVPAPFEEIGKRVGLTGVEVLERIRHLKKTGIIRKFRARIDQRKIGITANALVAWRPTGASNDDLGKRLAIFPTVTHCYERRPVPGRWEYSHYTVHHGSSKDQVQDEVKAIAGKIGCPDYLVLFSTREFKRVPNVRIGENEGGS